LEETVARSVCMEETVARTARPSTLCTASHLKTLNLNPKP